MEQNLLRKYKLGKRSLSVWDIVWTIEILSFLKNWRYETKCTSCWKILSKDISMIKNHSCSCEANKNRILYHIWDEVSWHIIIWKTPKYHTFKCLKCWKIKRYSSVSALSKTPCVCTRRERLIERMWKMVWKKIFKLTIVWLEYRENKMKYVCRCDCGNDTYVSPNVIAGGRKSCWHCKYEIKHRL